MRSVAIALVIACGVAVASRAQTADTSGAAGAGDPISRAQQLTTHGDTDAARGLLDSVVRASTAEDSLHAAALYARAALATSAMDSSRYYDRLLIEAPFSEFIPDALVRLAALDEVRGDRSAAIDHLSRFMLAFANDPRRAAASMTLVRLLFDTGNLPRACRALRWARDAVPATDVEQRNRLEYYGQRCATVPIDSAKPDTTTGARAKAAASSRRAVARDSASRASRAAAPPRKNTAPSATASDSVTVFSLQVAAYDTHAAAARAATTLVRRGIDARVDGTRAPFRVRIGRYGSRAEALTAIAGLKAKGITGFLTTATVARR